MLGMMSQQADEPCAGLNDTETADVVAILRAPRGRGVTVLLVEHDMRAVMEVSVRIFVIDAGSKTAEGMAEEVAADPLVIAADPGSDDD
jgi:branched-chain amino acid transport system ATP-binding protein